MLKATAGFTFAVSLILVSAMAYEWSFTETDLGGYFGVCAPIIGVLGAFMSGLFIGRK